MVNHPNRSKNSSGIVFRDDEEFVMPIGTMMFAHLDKAWSPPSMGSVAAKKYGASIVLSFEAVRAVSVFCYASIRKFCPDAYVGRWRLPIWKVIVDSRETDEWNCNVANEARPECRDSTGRIVSPSLFSPEVAYPGIQC